jgi:hypothetical protein
VSTPVSPLSALVPVVAAVEPFSIAPCAQERWLGGSAYGQAQQHAQVMGGGFGAARRDPTLRPLVDRPAGKRSPRCRAEGYRLDHVRQCR